MGKNDNRRHFETFFFFFPPESSCKNDNLHKLSKSFFRENYEKYNQFVVLN